MNAQTFPLALGFGNDVERQRGLSRGLWAVDFYDSALGYAADPEGAVKSNRSCGNRGDTGSFLVTEAHDRAFSILALDAGDGGVDGLFVLGIERHGGQAQVGVFQRDAERITRGWSVFDRGVKRRVLQVTSKQIQGQGGAECHDSVSTHGAQVESLMNGLGGVANPR